MRSTNLLYKIVLISSVIVAVLQIVAISLPDWLSFSNGQGKVTAGFWSTCISTDLTKVCVKNDLEFDWLDASRAFSILCLLLIILKFVFLILYLCMSKFQDQHAKLAVCLTSTFACVCGMISFIVIAAKKDEIPSILNIDFSTGFYIGVISPIFLLILAILSWFSFNTPVEPINIVA